MKYSRATSAILTYFYSFLILTYVKVSVGSLPGLPGLHATYSLPEPLQQPISITSSASHRLDDPLSRSKSTLKDTTSKMAHIASKLVLKSLGRDTSRQCCFGRVYPQIASKGKSSTTAPEREFRKESRKDHTIGHPTVNPSINQLQLDQMDKLNQWKSMPEVAYFIGELELGITQIVNAIIYLEVPFLAPEDLYLLLTRFASEEMKYKQTPETFAHLVQNFICDVYSSRIGSNQPNLVANTYLNNELKIYKTYASLPIFRLVKIEILECLKAMISSASRYYKDARREMDIWQEKVHSIIQMLKFIQTEMSPFKNNKIRRKLLVNQVSQTKVRSGDTGLFEFLETGAQTDISVKRIQSFLLLNTKGATPVHREKLFTHVQNIYDDLSSMCRNFYTPLNLNHRNALELQWD
ncbi:hypothetical protein PTTG_27481 [Puccinia triticina 1-1 BBBD Race 1]|uniref:Uncharacterized protein n=2 Tax=Puccinia triticina TaxID=208348 RepID=A0A180GJV0_PUCT1|nr:uncharacterized protein PtA15_6A668 [Puccinia triticina]OAV92930.1 hypothetical protein PTTG_27481 [Puccinia triticina 1-1 BBBD Race 1]WAQ86038.1 hypothetical protein PtA15_6A668 [Puccinia triticina]WAR55933.1 hypothetical protein PtB15_6B677 [Puccinia triticina]